MTRNQLANDLLKKLSGDPILTVDGSGHISPTSQQIVVRGGTLLIQSDSAGQGTYTGWICAYRSGACHCAELVTDLGTDPHMKVRNGSPYHISSSVAVDNVYQLYATANQPSGPTQAENNGDIRVGNN